MVVSHKIDSTKSVLTKDYTRVFGTEWSLALGGLLRSEYMTNLQYFIDESYKKTDKIYPTNQEDIFRSMQHVSPRNVKVVIFGDSPQPSAHANGFAFGSFRTTGGSKLPQTLAIEKCLGYDVVDVKKDFDPTLRSWAKQGVLLLNTTLMTDKDKSQKYEIVFRNLIREIIKVIDDKNVDCVFAFTSKRQEQRFSRFIDTTYNHILVYDGIKEDTSMFNDINVLIDQCYAGTTPYTIEW